MGFVAVPRLQLIEDRWNIPDAQLEILQVRGLLHGGHPLTRGSVLPHAVVAAGMLHEDGHIPTQGPVVAEKGAAPARPAEPVAEQDDRRRR
jgi:hypothetical protein